MVSPKVWLPTLMTLVYTYGFDSISMNLSSKVATEPKNENPIKSPKDPPRDPSNQISSWICISSCIVLEFDVKLIINWTWDKFPVSGVRNASSLLFAICSIRAEYCVISFCSKHVKMFSWILFAATVWESDWWHVVLKSKFRIWHAVSKILNS